MDKTQCDFVYDTANRLADDVLMYVANEVSTTGCTSPGFSGLSNMYYMYDHHNWTESS